MVDRLKGKVALVTGAARGIGRATAELFALEGATVISGDVLEAEDAGSSPVEFLPLDVTSREGWKQIVDGIVARHGKIDILMNNAAVCYYEPILETTDELWDKVLDIDLKSIFYGMRETLPHMISRKQGSIINVASIWGLAGVPSAHAYQAAKGAILNVSKNVAATHGQDGIRCNSLHPGYIVTPMNKDQGPVIEAALIEGSLLKRAGQPMEIAYAALFLASDEASYITGTSLVVDGGYLAP
ncbi:SDR family oxidoreductase [Mesorhizobium sp. BR1-1-16]|uniref:SDR family NAD(P)-dependent oxidoreductase n=1 Tax=Mesorhizobium sp. BR1-1-16 TaxID=2876653 RepID=UPI001CCE9581|nr:SDR family oxidoreductase [Mesorhizobium sp. BR1-1-16]MBZ9936890.1 SDR family oxidoreductase [Mesorhizobium sp. BR1-1-16]